MNRFAAGRIVNRLRRVSAWNPLGAIVSVRTRDAAAALTFDDGPDPATTPRVAEILERKGARGTFFMLGVKAAARPDLVGRLAAAGHAVANHSWDHAFLPSLPARLRRAQIRRCDEALGPHGSSLFRPPYGNQSTALAIETRLLGFRTVGWSLDSGDWWNPDPESMRAFLARRIRPGAIVLFHDHLNAPSAGGTGPALVARPLPDRAAMQDALASFLEETSNRFQYVTLPELLRRGRPVIASRRDSVAPEQPPSRRQAAAAGPSMARMASPEE